MPGRWLEKVSTIWHRSARLHDIATGSTGSPCRGDRLDAAMARVRGLDRDGRHRELAMTADGMVVLRGRAMNPGLH